VGHIKQFAFYSRVFMDKEINTIKVDNIFRVTFGKHVISFWLQGMPRNIHFSISFNDNSGFVNFHVSRNVGDHNNKSKIEIARISKLDLKELEFVLGMTFLKSFLEPITIKPFYNLYKETGKGNKSY
jgi:hypothetical protein